MEMGRSPVSVQGSEFSVGAWMDAGRGEVFAAFYAPTATATSIPTPIDVPLVAPPQVALEAAPVTGRVIFTGDGAAKYKSEILQGEGARHQVIAHPATLAQYFAHIGIARAKRGEAGPPHALQPLYVRRPDAELERQRREVG